MRIKWKAVSAIATLALVGTSLVSSPADAAGLGAATASESVGVAGRTLLPTAVSQKRPVVPIAMPARDLSRTDYTGYARVKRDWTPIKASWSGGGATIGYLNKGAVVRIASYNDDDIVNPGVYVETDDSMLENGYWDYNGYLLTDNLELFRGSYAQASSGRSIEVLDGIPTLPKVDRTVPKESWEEYVVVLRKTLIRCNNSPCNGIRSKQGAYLPAGAVVKYALWNKGMLREPGQWISTDDEYYRDRLGQGFNMQSDDILRYDLYMKTRYLGEAKWSRQNIGSGWASTKYTHIFNAGDLDRNGYEDMMLTDRAGNLWFYPMKSSTKFYPRKKVGYGWNNMRKIFGGVDFNGDGRVDILGISKTGVLYYYPGRGNGTFMAKVKVGSGWGNVTNISATQRGFNGKPVIMGSRYGVLHAWQTDGRAHITSTTKYGSGWDAVKLTAISRDVSGDGVADMWVVWKNGTLSLYQAANAQGTKFKRSDLGSGWAKVRYFLPRMSNARVIRAIFPDGYLRQYTLLSYTPARQF